MRGTARTSWIAVLAIAAVLAAADVAAFRWGVILPDTVVQYGQVLSGRYEDWHPPVTAWLWRWIGGGRFGSAPFLILVCTAAWAGLGLFAIRMRRDAGAGWALAVLAIGCTPIVFGQFGAILKDSLLAAVLLLAGGMLACAGAGIAAPGPGGRARWWIALPTAGLLLLAAATRFNAFFAAAPLAVLLLPEEWRRGPWRHLALSAGCGLALLGGATIVNRVMLRPVAQQPFLSLVAFDLAGITRASGRNVLPMPDAAARAGVARCYDPAMYNRQNDPACDLEGGLIAHAAATGESGTAVWRRAIAREPLAYARHRLAHFNRNQRWHDAAVPEDAVYLMSAENAFGLHFAPGRAALAIGAAAEYWARTPLGRPATWLAVAAGLLIVAGRLRTAGLVRALALSALLYGDGYLVVSVAPDLRYNLWTMLAAMLGLIVALAEWRVLSRRLTAIAAVPVVIAVLGELL